MHKLLQLLFGKRFTINPIHQRIETSLKLALTLLDDPVDIQAAKTQIKIALRTLNLPPSR
jgi:hypothetical protein